MIGGRLATLMVALASIGSQPAPAVVTAAEPGREQAAGGVVIEQLREDSPLFRAGLRRQDVLWRWQRPAGGEAVAAAGELRSVFDWFWLELEEAPLGSMRLVGERAGEPLAVDVAPGGWTAEVRPVLEAERLADYERGAELIESGEAAAGIALWDRVAATAAAAERAWLALKTARAWAAAGEADRSAAAFETALAAAEGPVATSSLWDEWARVRMLQNDVAGARAAFEKALELRRRNWGEGLSYAKTLGGLYQLSWMTGDLDETERVAGEAQEILGRLAPDSPEQANTSDALAGVAWRRGELGRAEELFEEGLAIRRRLGPEGMEVSASLNNLGLLAYSRGDFDRAADLYARSVGIREALAPDSLEHAEILNNLGLLAVGQGRLEEADEHYRRTLDLVNRLAPGSIFVAYTLNNLGGLALMRGELETAREFHLAALEIRERISPDSLEVASILGNLGSTAYRRGDLEEAAGYHRRALEIREATAPGGLLAAESLNNLGTALRDAGDLEAAAALYDRALAIRRAKAPGSLALALSLKSGGILAGLEGDPDRAREHHEEAAGILDSVAPGSRHVATVREELGRLARRARRNEEALAHFAAGMTAVERQVGRLGGSLEVKGTYRAAFAGLYHEAIDLQLELGRRAEAFATLERWRSRNFLNMLAERDLVLTAEDVPQELDRERRRIAHRHDQIHERMSGLSATDDAESLERLHSELRALGRERAAVEARLRQASPRLAALQYPEPLTAAGAAAALDRGTVLLSYGVGETATYLFILDSAGDLAVERLAVGREELASRVERFRNLIVDSRVEPLGRIQRAGLDRLAQHLYELLVAPAAAAVDTADRLLIAPDGPLHLMPFAALRRDSAEGEYLIEALPVHVTLSATVYAASRGLAGADSGAEPPARLVAFGDPRLPGPAAAGAEPTDGHLRSIVERGLFDYRPLPHSRTEVEAIAALFAGEEVRTYLGGEATEERVRSAAGDARILHLATHGSVDERFPLNSALVLSIPERPATGRGNGLLQAWEVIEQVRLDADLVVLSGCATGLGRSVGGEGLIGLTRAFQYAGARSVVASLWNVSDRATAELMRRFYRGLRDGLPIDRALRRAQVELIQGPLELGEGDRLDVAAPYYWAAFQLYGDWQ